MLQFLTALLFVSVSSASPSRSLEEQEVVYNTFSIAAVDPETGEVGVAVTTRNPCVGNGVPWVRVGVGAVATQASTRTAYGDELLDLLEKGVSAEDALRRTVGADDRAPRRQIGVIGLTGGHAQHTGSETSYWAGHRAGATYVTQGNLLVGPEVLDAVARSFESTEGSGRHLADRLIAALEAGQATGGDARKGRKQSAAVLVADPREARSRRADKISTNINVCENPTPVLELRRIYDSISETLGFRTLQQFSGRDVVQLKIMLEALGFLQNGKNGSENGDDSALYTEDVVAAVEKFRQAVGLSTSASGSPPGLVDEATVELLWERLEAEGKASAIRERFREITAITR